MWGTISLAEALKEPKAKRSSSEIECELAQLERQHECALSDREREEIYHQIRNLHDELEELAE